MTKDNSKHESLLPRQLVKAACDHCKKPVYCDQGYHGMSLNHWMCEGKHQVNDMRNDPMRATRLMELGAQYCDELLQDLEKGAGK